MSDFIDVIIGFLVGSGVVWFLQSRKIKNLKDQVKKIKNNQRQFENIKQQNEQKIQELENKYREYIQSLETQVQELEISKASSTENQTISLESENFFRVQLQNEREKHQNEMQELERFYDDQIRELKKYQPVQAADTETIEVQPELISTVIPEIPPVFSPAKITEPSFNLKEPINSSIAKNQEEDDIFAVFDNLYEEEPKIESTNFDLEEFLKATEVEDPFADFPYKTEIGDQSSLLTNSSPGDLDFFADWFSDDDEIEKEFDFSTLSNIETTPHLDHDPLENIIKIESKPEDHKPQEH
jgi:hypothetical protein